jgi:hypothetical protein
MTKSDAALEERALSFHRGDAPPLVKHWVHAPDPTRQGRPKRLMRINLSTLPAAALISDEFKNRWASERELFFRRCSTRDLWNGRRSGDRTA